MARVGYELRPLWGAECNVTRNPSIRNRKPGKQDTSQGRIGADLSAVARRAKAEGVIRRFNPPYAHCLRERSRESQIALQSDFSNPGGAADVAGHPAAARPAAARTGGAG
jgi:hypothetical protein